MVSIYWGPQSSRRHPAGANLANALVFLMTEQGIIVNVLIGF